jgi:hypothetical protein
LENPEQPLAVDISDQYGSEQSLPTPQLVARIRELRVSGYEPAADELLRTAAAGGDGTDAALLIVLLRLENRGPEADRAIEIAASGPEWHTATVTHGLLRLGSSEECGTLLAAAARRPPARVAPLAKALLEAECPGQAAQFLAEAAAYGARTRMLDTVMLELCADGMAAHAWPALWSVVREWAPDRLLALAEHLDSVGADAVALRTYAQAGEVIAGNWPADRLAALMRRMDDAGLADAAGLLFDAAVKSIGSFPSMTAYLATALVAAGLPETAKELLDRTAPALSDVELASLTSYLDAGRQKELAVHAFGAAAMVRPAQATIGFADTLRRHGQAASADLLTTRVLLARPVLAADLLGWLRGAGREEDARRLLDLLARSSPEVCAAAGQALWLAGDDADAEQLLGALAEWPLVDLAPALVSTIPLGAGQAGESHPLVRRLLSRTPTEYASAVRTLRERAALDRGRQEQHAKDRGENITEPAQGRADAGREAEAAAERLLALLRIGPPRLVLLAALALVDRGLAGDAGALLDHYGSHAPAEDAAELFTLLERAGRGGTDLVAAAALTGRTDAGAFLAAIRRAGAWAVISRHLEQLARSLPGPDLVELCVSLAEQDALADLDSVITGIARRDDYEAQRLALHKAGRHSLAYRLTERYGELTGR